MALGGAPEHEPALRLYLAAHERLLEQAQVLKNSYETDYLENHMNRTRDALER